MRWPISRARFLPDMMLEPNLNKYRLVLADTAEELADPQRFAERQEIAKIVETAARQRPDLGPGVIAQMLALSDTLLLRDVTPVGLMSAIDDLRKAAGHVGADVVVVVDDSSADLTMEDNDISGFVALYGTVDQELTRKVWTKEARSAAAAAIRGNTLTLAAGGGVLQLDNNRMTGIAVGRDMLKRLLEAPPPVAAAPKVTLTQIYRHAGLVNNVFFGHASTWLAQSVGLASNLFALNEPVPIDQAGAQTQALAGLSISAFSHVDGQSGTRADLPGPVVGAGTARWRCAEQC